MHELLPADLLSALRAGVLDDAGAAEVRARLGAAGWPDAERTPLDGAGCALLLGVLDEAAPWAGATRLGAALAAAAGERDVADGVLGALRSDGLVERRVPLAEALRAAAGRVDVRAIVEARLGLPRVSAVRRVRRRSPLASALAREAGQIDLADAVFAAIAAPMDEGELLSALLDGELRGDARDRLVARLAADRALGVRMTALAHVGRGLREAIEQARGPEVDVWPRVAGALGLSEEIAGWRGEAVADALRRAAGAVDVADEVMEVVEADALASLPEPANRRSWSAFVAVAAAAILLLAVLPRWLAPSGGDGFEAVPVQFATAGEVNVDEIRSGPDATVFVEVPSGDEAPLIIWVDDGGAP